MNFILSPVPTSQTFGSLESCTCTAAVYRFHTLPGYYDRDITEIYRPFSTFGVLNILGSTCEVVASNGAMALRLMSERAVTIMEKAKTKIAKLASRAITN